MIAFNTGETSEDLKAHFNPEGSTLKKAQDRMLDMLLYLDNVCKEQNVPYRIDAGNVLGAVRHGGFIPWDDDVDIVLLRRN
jgi:lipopolysaccharide cholinephosphotransferase